MKKASFSWRAFISLGLFASLVMLLVSGLVLFLAPPGRIANWTDWNILGLSKKEWQNQHTIFSIAFVLLSIFHLFSINWKAFWSYIAGKARTGINKPFEFFSITFLALLLGFGTHLGLQPFRAVINFSEFLTESWEEPAKRPPAPHTERMTLREVSKRFATNKDPGSLQELLEAKGITVRSLDQTLENIAEKNRTSAQKIYEMLDLPPTKSSGGGRGRGKNRNR